MNHQPLHEMLQVPEIRPKTGHLKRLGWQSSLLLGALSILLGCSDAALDTPQIVDLQGTVRDSNGPVADAVVRIQATDLRTHTDQQGRFAFPELDADTPVSISAWAPG